jgi:hypothetical protein
LLALAATGIAAIASQGTVSEDFIKGNSSGLGIGSRTELANANSATFMSHEIGFAQEVSGKTEYAASSRSMRGEYESINFGVLSGDGSAGKSGYGGVDPVSSAWKNPAIEIEEEYIGTYHITKNFTINNIYLPEPVFISADDVFNCKKYKLPL